MALTPHINDPNRENILKHREKLMSRAKTSNKEDAEVAKDALKGEFNVDADGKSAITLPKTGKEVK